MSNNNIKEAIKILESIMFTLGKYGVSNEQIAVEVSEALKLLRKNNGTRN